MNKIETVIVGLFIGIACPYLTFVLFWWSSAILHMTVSGIPIRVVIVSAFTGLGLGLSLDVIFLRWWVRKFYISDMRWMIVLYLAFSVVAVASFMGLPVGIIAWGTLAGVYMGRRASHANIDWIAATHALRKTSYFTATITALVSLPIGLLALNESDIRKMLESMTGISQTSLQGLAGYAFVVFLCAVLFFIQYWLSNMAGRITFRLDHRLEHSSSL